MKTLILVISLAYFPFQLNSQSGNTKPTGRLSSEHVLDQNSHLDAFALSKIPVADLQLVGQMWGFLKYYHPRVRKGDYNFDEELFRVLSQLTNAKDKKERNEILCLWIKGLGSVKAGKREAISEERIKLRPDFTWLDKDALGKDLYVLLTTIKDAKRTKTNYYPTTSLLGNTNFRNDSFFYLPGGIQTMISGLGVYYPNGQETQRVGIIPDIEVKPTLKGIKEGKDELLEKAMQVLKGP